MPHDGWRQFLPFLIQLYKTGTATVGTEGVVSWSRPNPIGSCSDGDTTLNTASQLQLEYLPGKVLKDKVFYSALMGSVGDVTVSIGGTHIKGTWSTVPHGGVGVYHGSVETGGATGTIVVTITRSGSAVMKTSGKAAITSSCTSGFNNFNAIVDSGVGLSVGAKTPIAISSLVPTAGFGVNGFAGLCEFTCSYGYCPESACTRTNLGTQKTKPKDTGIKGYPLEGQTAAYGGLCDFACNLGYCPSTSCGTVKKPTAEGNVSPFVPATCNQGSGPGNFEGLCRYGCDFGFCPIRACTCSRTGNLNKPPPLNLNILGFTTDGSKDHGLCTFACGTGYCPAPCDSKNRTDTSTGDDDYPKGTPKPMPTCTTTVQNTAYPAVPAIATNETPINGNRYFAISQECYSDTKVAKGFANKGVFYEQMYKDAQVLADSALDWPQYGTDASDLYFGKGTEDERYSKDIHSKSKAHLRPSNTQNAQKISKLPVTGSTLNSVSIIISFLDALVMVEEWGVARGQSEGIQGIDIR